MLGTEALLEGHKRCPSCQRLLSFDMYSKNRRRAYGVDTICKRCRSEVTSRCYRRSTAAVRLFRWARDRAARRGIQFTIDREDIVIPAHCPVLKIPMDRPSLDRINPDRGYVPGNVQVISFRANTLKNNATREELAKVLAYMKRIFA